MDIKEIATRLEPQYWHPDRGVGEFFDTCGFAQALVAEIQRQSEPLIACPKSGGGYDYCTKDGLHVGANGDGSPLFTFPPSIEALEDKIAEACAAYLSNRAKPNLEAAQVMDDSVAAIRSGEWRKFLKGE